MREVLFSKIQLSKETYAVIYQLTLAITVGIPADALLKGAE